MTNFHNRAVAMLGGVAMLAAFQSLKAQSFSDDFESGLGQWTGKSGGPHHGITVLDPLNSGHGSVLTFTALNSGGDIYSLSITGPFVISFDYLGLPALGGVTGDLGGFVGISDSNDPQTPFTDHFWFAATQEGYPGIVISLIDDGAWHHYSISLDGILFPSSHIMLEDFSGSGGVAGDAFFDNFLVTPIPEPSVSALTCFGITLILLIPQARRGHNAAAHRLG